MDGFLPTFTRRKLSPPGFKEDTWDKPVLRIADPPRVIIPLQDRCGAPYELTLEEGDAVLAGQTLGTLGSPPASLSVHASISGTVEKIAPHPHPLGFDSLSVSVVSDGRDACCNYLPLAQRSLEGSREKMFEAFREMGIPLNYQLFSSQGWYAPRLIVNATEFEPYLTSKHFLIRDYAPEVIKGLSTLMEACAASRAEIIIEKGKSRVREALERATGGLARVEITAVTRPYPETAGTFLVRALTPKQTAHRSSGEQKNGICVDLFSLFAINRAWSAGTPFIEQLITVAGSGVREPQTLWARTGTPLSELIKRLGGDPASTGRIALGGPLMGIPQHTLEVPLVKKAKGVFTAAAFLFDAHRESRFYKKVPCIKCAKCVDVCPVSLTPSLLASFIENKLYADARLSGVFVCVECGLCEYVCPSRIPLLELMRLGKVNLQGEESLLSRSNLESLGG